MSAQDWKTITPEVLTAPVEHIRNMFEEGVWKCTSMTEKLCFAAPHPEEEHADITGYKAAFLKYLVIIGADASQEFHRQLQKRRLKSCA